MHIYLSNSNIPRHLTQNKKHKHKPKMYNDKLHDDIEVIILSFNRATHHQVKNTPNITKVVA